MASSRRKALPASKRMRLSKQGEIRALLRLGASGEFAPQIKEVVMATEALDELIEPTIVLHNTKAHITLDQATTKALYELAWEKLERALIEANALYNGAGDFENEHDRATQLHWACQDLKQLSDVIYTLTPLPDELED